MLSIISDQTNLNDSKYTLSVKVIKNHETKYRSFLMLYLWSHFHLNMGQRMIRVICENMPNVCQELD